MSSHYDSTQLTLAWENVCAEVDEPWVKTLIQNLHRALNDTLRQDEEVSDDTVAAIVDEECVTLGVESPKMKPLRQSLRRAVYRFPIVVVEDKDEEIEWGTNEAFDDAEGLAAALFGLATESADEEELAAVAMAASKPIPSASVLLEEETPIEVVGSPVEAKPTPTAVPNYSGTRLSSGWKASTNKSGKSTSWGLRESSRLIRIVDDEIKRLKRDAAIVAFAASAQGFRALNKS